MDRKHSGRIILFGRRIPETPQADKRKDLREFPGGGKP